MNLSWENIVQEIREDDQPSFERLYHYFFPKLSYFSSQYLSNREDSRSIVQEVFAELWENRKKLRNDTNIQAWLFTVTKNKSLKQISKERSRQHYIDHLKERVLDTNYQSLSGLDTSDFVFEELKEQIETALSKLSPAVRSVFEKSRYEEKKYKEIAEELNINVKTVEAHISNALKQLREELKDYLPLFFF